MLPGRVTRSFLCALAALAVSLPVVVTQAAEGASVGSSAGSPTASCDAISPIAIPCVALGKFADAVAIECRRVAIPEQYCTIPLSYKVTRAARNAYRKSWVHRAAAFQYRLGDSLPLAQAQWIGTHNSFNSLTTSFTISHADSNQQLTLVQQLDIDVRALELDLHYIPRLEALGAKGVTVCHGQAPSELDLGCTTEPLFADVLPPIATWLKRHPRQVVLLYLEDKMFDEAAYASTLSTLDSVLRREDGTSLIYHPDAAAKADNGCTPLPLDISRDDVRAAGAQVVLVGACAPGWSAEVFDWNAVHVESGSTSAYRGYPTCDATYQRGVYTSSIVRYFEDTTLVSTLLDPSRAPKNPEALTPSKVKAMTRCGVNVYGLDQLLPEDGRIQATLWSWAPDEPRARAGRCAVQRANGRWYAKRCSTKHRVACQAPNGRWRVPNKRVRFADAAKLCRARGKSFEVPRSGDQNSALRAVKRPTGGVWVNFRKGR